MGAIVNETQTQGIMHFVDEGKKSATLITGGERIYLEGKGCFVQPTIFADLEQSNPLARDEIFGPVLSVIAFDTEAEAIEMANDSIYGLAASLWTDNLSRACRVAEELNVGTYP